MSAWKQWQFSPFLLAWPERMIRWKNTNYPFGGGPGGDRSSRTQIYYRGDRSRARRDGFRRGLVWDAGEDPDAACFQDASPSSCWLEESPML